MTLSNSQRVSGSVLRTALQIVRNLSMLACESQCDGSHSCRRVSTEVTLLKCDSAVVLHAWDLKTMWGKGVCNLTRWQIFRAGRSCESRQEHSVDMVLLTLLSAATGKGEVSTCSWVAARHRRRAPSNTCSTTAAGQKNYHPEK